MRFIYVFLLFLISFCAYASNPNGVDFITATVSDIEWSCLVTNDEVVIGRGRVSGNYSDAAVDCVLEGKIAIPAQIDGKNVVGINDCAFVGCGKITEVAVPASVRWLGKEVFYKCSSLETIVFLGDLPQIDDQVFSGLNARPIVRVSAMTGGWCQYVKSGNFMGLPIEYVEEQISVDGQDYCDTGAGLILVCARNCGAYFEIPAEASGKAVISVGAYAFVDSGASVVVLPSGVEQVHTQAFSGTSSLTMVLCVGSKPDGFDAAIDASQLVGLEKVKLCEGCYFANESFVAVYPNASRVVFPSGLLEIPELCCVGLTNLCDVVVPSSVTNIARSAFCSCPCLTNVVFASGLQSIGSNAFRLCERLSAVELPDSVKMIHSGAFAKCSSLRAISLPHDLQHLGPPATSTKTIYSYREDGTTREVVQVMSYMSAGDGVFEGCVSLTNVVFNSGLRSIGYSTFRYCRSLKQVRIPETVYIVFPGAFACCDQLTDVLLSDGVSFLGAYYPCRTTDVYEADGILSCRDIRFPDLLSGETSAARVVYTYNADGSIGSKTVIPFGDVDVDALVFSKQDGVFENCSSLTNVVLSSTLQAMHSVAFKDCTDLQCVTFRGKKPCVDGGWLYEGTPVNLYTKIVKDCEDSFYTNGRLPPLWQRRRIIGPSGEVVPLLTDSDVKMVRSRFQARLASLQNLQPAELNPYLHQLFEEVSFCPQCFEDLLNFYRQLPNDSRYVSFGDLVTIESLVLSGQIDFPAYAEFLNYSGLPVSEIAAKTMTVATDVGKAYQYIKKEVVNNTDTASIVITTTNVVVHYVVNSIRPEFAEPISSDVGFVTVITEVESSGVVSVPSEWPNAYPEFVSLYGTQLALALGMKTGKKDGMGRDMLVWQDYVAGTDPTNPDDQFKASITMVNGAPVISYTPELTDEQKALRVYKTFGKRQLQDEVWIDLTGKASELFKDYNFFKVTVGMK